MWVSGLLMEVQKGISGSERSTSLNWRNWARPFIWIWHLRCVSLVIMKLVMCFLWLGNLTDTIISCMNAISTLSQIPRFPPKQDKEFTITKSCCCWWGTSDWSDWMSETGDKTCRKQSTNILVTNCSIFKYTTSYLLSKNIFVSTHLWQKTF